MSAMIMGSGTGVAADDPARRAFFADLSVARQGDRGGRGGGAGGVDRGDRRVGRASDAAQLIYRSNVASIKAVGDLKSVVLKAQVDAANQALSPDDAKYEEVRRCLHRRSAGFHDRGSRIPRQHAGCRSAGGRRPADQLGRLRRGRGHQADPRREPQRTGRMGEDPRHRGAAAADQDLRRTRRPGQRRDRRRGEQRRRGEVGLRIQPHHLDRHGGHRAAARPRRWVSGGPQDRAVADQGHLRVRRARRR